MVDPVQFFGAGMDMHQGLARSRHLEQGVAATGHLAQARPDGDDQIAAANSLGKPRVDANADVARIQRVVVVKGVLKAKGVAHRQAPVVGKALQGLGGLHSPATTPGDHDRSLRLQEQFAQPAQCSRVAPGVHRRQARQRLGIQASHRVRLHGLGQHVFGQNQHHWPGAAIHGGGKGPRHVFGDALRIVDALHPFGHSLGARAKKTGIVDFLERLTVARVARHITDKQHHGA